MNKNIAWHLPDAQSVRGTSWGDMIEILVKRQEVIWTGACRREGMVSVCSCLHSRWDLFKMRPLTTWLPLSLSLCEYLSTDLQLTDITAYVKSARVIILISPHKHKTSVQLSPVKPTDHLCEKLYSWQQRGSFVCRNSKSGWLWSYHEDVFSLRKDNAPALNPNWDPSACCTQEINKMWWNKWGNSFCISKHCSTQHSKSCKINRLKSKEKEAFFLRRHQMFVSYIFSMSSKRADLPSVSPKVHRKQTKHVTLTNYNTRKPQYDTHVPTQPHREWRAY